MTNLPAQRSTGPARKRRSTLDILDDGLLVLAVVVAVFLVLNVIHFIAWAIFAVVKVAVLAAIVFVIARFAVRSRAN